MSNPNNPSGIYKCTNEVVHSQGEPFAPCGSCNNNDWKLVKQIK